MSYDTKRLKTPYEIRKMIKSGFKKPSLKVDMYIHDAMLVVLAFIILKGQKVHISLCLFPKICTKTFSHLEKLSKCDAFKNWIF